MQPQLCEWSYRLRVSQETFGTNPETSKGCLSVFSLVSHLTHSGSDFSFEWSVMCRTMKMKEGATLDKIRDFVHLLEPELMHRGLEEGARRHLPQDQNMSQHAEWFEAMPMQQQDLNQSKVEAESCPAERGLGRVGMTPPTRIGIRSTTRPRTTPRQLQRCVHQQGKETVEGHGTDKRQGHSHKERERRRKDQAQGSRQRSRRKDVKKVSCVAYLDWKECSKGRTPKMPDRCFVCRCMGHQNDQCPHKAAQNPKGGLADVAEV